MSTGLLFSFCYSGWSIVVHFNSQFTNKSMYGMIKLTITKLIEWATFWCVNHDHSLNVCKMWQKKKGEMAARYSPPMISRLLDSD